jgi:hypothetical protein
MLRYPRLVIQPLRLGSPVDRNRSSSTSCLSCPTTYQEGREGLRTWDIDASRSKYREWHVRIYKSFARVDFRVKRMIAFHQRQNPGATE